MVGRRAAGGLCLIAAASMLSVAGAASPGAGGLGGLSAGISQIGACSSGRMSLRGAGPLRLRGGEGDVVSPTVWWSQREDSLFMKVDMPPGMHNADGLKVGETALVWEEGNVKLNMEFNAAVNVSTAKVHCDGGRQATVHVQKEASGWWPRLTAAAKLNNVKVDWSTWKDEDEVDDEKEEGAPGMDADFNYDDLANMPDLEGLKGAADASGEGEGEGAAPGAGEDAEMHDDAAGDAAGDEVKGEGEEMQE